MVDFKMRSKFSVANAVCKLIQAIYKLFYGWNSYGSCFKARVQLSTAVVAS